MTTLLDATVALLAQLVAGQSGPATLAAVGLVGVTLLLIAWAVRPVAPVAAAPAAWSRRHAEPVPFVRLRHPAAAGRPRPRAPSAGPAPAARPGTAPAR
ncbi:hypothetical protein GCM10009677_06390 [Sphaerisporangium rubeum]|uniref:Nicotinamidase-related amidase n=1 Tax=Sphaerisporangium rubeum TaxID=321317 RepID=A0A7X0MBA7_9ACTN|nr:nicotinamidase-related amidase [Sphaerisporangium rubeum]